MPRPRPHRRRLAGTLCLLALAALGAGAPATSGLAIYGGASPLYGRGGCVRDFHRDAPSERRCPGTAKNLEGAAALALSPDGRDVYVAATDSGALTTFGRDPSTGGLRPLSSLGGDPALAGADAVAVSPDGRFVYAGGRDSAAVSAYARAGRGSLRALPRHVTPARGKSPAEFGCVSGYTLSGARGTGCAVQQEALVGISALAVSPDGRNVYAVSFGLAPGEDSIVAMARDPRTGGLSPLRGSGGCFQSRPVSHCTASSPGLEGARSVIVSRDGRFVYVASEISSSVVAFARDAKSGRLRPLTGPGGCVSSSSAKPAPARDDAPCVLATPQLGGAEALALSPDGRQLYVAAFDPGAVIALARDPISGRVAPTFSPPLCLQATPDDACPIGLPALHGADALAPSPDGRTVWVACQGADSVVALRRDPVTGRLTLVSAAPTSGAPLAAPQGLVAGPGAKQLYAVSPTDDAVAGLAARG